MRYPLGMIAAEGLNVARAWASHAAGATWSRPMTLNLILTERCNSRCTTCDYWKRNGRARDELTLPEIERLAHDLGAMGTRMVALSGGEPTLREDLPEIIAAFKRHGFLVQLTTNGLLLDTERGQRLLGGGLDRLTISYDSHLPARYEEIRGVDAAADLDRRMRAILRASPRPVLETNTVILGANLDEVPATLEHLLSLGVDGVNFSPAVAEGDNNVLDAAKPELVPLDAAAVARCVDGLLLLKAREPVRVRASAAFIARIPAYFSAPTVPPFDCWAGYVSLDVYQDGSVRLCGSTAPVGSLRERGVRDIWTGAAAQLRRREMLAGQCPGCYVSCKAEPSLVVAPRTAVRAAVQRLRT